MRNVLILNEKKFAKIKKNFSHDSIEKILIISDFDRTLTKEFVNGQNIPSLISILRKDNYLSADYSSKANALFEKYHPIEKNQNISLKKRKKLVKEWWTKHFDLLIKSGLSKNDIRKVINSNKLTLRKDFDEFINILKKYDIPLVIISSSGLGTDSIAMYLKKEKELFDNIYIISNSYQWNKKGKAVGINQPIIHSLNKDEIDLKKFNFFKKIKNRKNVLLLGNSLEDIGMIKQFKYNNLLKIGFLNKNINERIKAYKKVYDILILNDGSMKFINNFLKEIAKSKVIKINKHKGK